MAEAVFFTRWRQVSDAGAQLDACADLDQLLEVLRERARAIALADGVTVVRRDGDHVTYVGEDAIAPLWTGQRFPIARCVSGIAITQRAPVLIEDIRGDDRVPLNLYLATFVRSMAMFPIGGGQPVAALGCYWARLGGMDPDAMTLIDALTRSANATLERLAIEAERRDIRLAMR